MRPSSFITLLVIAGATVLFGVSSRRSRPPVELTLVSSRPLDAMNGKEFMLVTVAVGNRSRTPFWFGPVEEIYAKAEGGWTDVSQDFNGGWVAEAGKIQKRLVLPAGVQAIRLHFDYQFHHFPPTWMAVLLRKLGPTPTQLVAKIPWLGKRVWPATPNPPSIGITLEVKIPPSASKPDKLSANYTCCYAI